MEKVEVMNPTIVKLTVARNLNTCEKYKSHKRRSQGMVFVIRKHKQKIKNKHID